MTRRHACRILAGFPALSLLAQNRPPEMRPHNATEVAPRLQHILDALASNPAIVRTATWDVLAWNRAAAIVFGDYGALPPEDRNALFVIFCNQQVRARMPDWERDARHVVAAFRADATRAGDATRTKAIVDRLCAASTEFEQIWSEHDVRASREGTKQVQHPSAGSISLDYTSFGVDGRPELKMIVYSASTPSDARKLQAMLA